MPGLDTNKRVSTPSPQNINAELASAMGLGRNPLCACDCIPCCFDALVPPAPNYPVTPAPSQAPSVVSTDSDFDYCVESSDDTLARPDRDSATLLTDPSESEEPWEPAVPVGSPLRVRARAGSLGEDEQVVWRLSAPPLTPMSVGQVVHLLDPRGQPRGVDGVVTGVVGCDQNWITFLLNADHCGFTRAQTISAPRSHTNLPIPHAIFHCLARRWLPDAHADIRLPLAEPREWEGV